LAPTVFCNRCGHHHPEGTHFCSSCGSVLERSTGCDPATTTITFTPVGAVGEAGATEVCVAVGDVPPGAGVLAVMRGPEAGSRYLLSVGVTTLGRHPDNDIFLDDVTVSRRQAEITATGYTFTVRDLDSLNGTYLNGERTEEAVLHSGDELQIGKFRLVFVAGPPRSDGERVRSLDRPSAVSPPGTGLRHDHHPRAGLWRVRDWWMIPRGRRRAAGSSLIARRVACGLILEPQTAREHIVRVSKNAYGLATSRRVD
jgi:hypothetical protein